MASIKSIFCGALLICIAMAACQKKNEAPTPGVAGNTAAAPAAGTSTPGTTTGATAAAPSAPDSPPGGSPGPKGSVTPGTSGSGATNGVTGSGTLNAPRMDPVPGQTANTISPAASAATR